MSARARTLLFRRNVRSVIVSLLAASVLAACGSYREPGETRGAAPGAGSTEQATSPPAGRGAPFEGAGQVPGTSGQRVFVLSWATVGTVLAVFFVAAVVLGAITVNDALRRPPDGSHPARH